METATGRTIRWGVIGTGGIAMHRVIPEALAVIPGCRLMAAMDLDLEALDRAAVRFGVERLYTSEADILADDEIDAVYIASPTFLHARQAILAADHRKHILCEKPLALTPQECDAIEAAVARNGVKLMVGFMMRFHPAHQAARQMITSGQLGQIVSARIHRSAWYPPVPGAWRQQPEFSGGGALMDIGVHCFDLLRWLVGEAEVVSSLVDRLVHDYPVEDSAAVLLRFANGGHGLLSTYFNIGAAAPRHILEIYGTRGSILTHDTIGQGGGGQIWLTRQDENGLTTTVPVAYQPGSTYRAEVEHFCACLREDRQPAISIADGRAAQVLIQAAYGRLG